MTLAVETHQLTQYFNDFCPVRNIDLAFERETFFEFLGLDAGKSNTRHHNQRSKTRRFFGPTRPRRLLEEARLRAFLLRFPPPSPSHLKIPGAGVGPQVPAPTKNRFPRPIGTPSACCQSLPTGVSAFRGKEMGGGRLVRRKSRKALRP